MEVLEIFDEGSGLSKLFVVMDGTLSAQDNSKALNAISVHQKSSPLWVRSRTVRALLVSLHSQDGCNSSTIGFFCGGTFVSVVEAPVTK